MKYVIDANVGLMWEADELLTVKAQLLRDDFERASTGIHEVRA